MQRLTIGMRVCDVRNRLVGVISRINACCFEVDRRPTLSLFLVSGAVYNVEAGEVDLICDTNELGRYACGLHNSAA